MENGELVPRNIAIDPDVPLLDNALLPFNLLVHVGDIAYASTQLRPPKMYEYENLNGESR